jgi:hypothetical protein
MVRLSPPSLDTMQLNMKGTNWKYYDSGNKQKCLNLANT